MNIQVFPTADQAGQAVAQLIAAQLLLKPDSVLGLATGSTPMAAYRHLVAAYRAGVVSFRRATSYNLDEYVNLSEDHPCSYHHFMQENLFSQVDMRPEAIHLPNGLSSDPAADARAYDAAIVRAGGIDLQVLGIGQNGHIGFNEPGDRFIRECHVVNLTDSTIDANQRFFSSRDEVPRQAISLGIETIMKAKTILLIATGKEKAQAIHDAVLSNVTPQVQASILQFHPKVCWLLDREAASLLPQEDIDEYRVTVHTET